MCKRLIYLISVLVLSFACTSYADVVIGDFEGSMDGFGLTWEGTSTIALSNIGATSGSQSLVLTGPTNAFSWAVMWEGLVDLVNYNAISADITWVTSEWAPADGIWVNFKELAVNSDGPSGWAEYIPTDVVNPDWPGSWDPANWGDQTRTLTWDISGYDATGATWMQIIFSTNMGGVTTAGNFYIDNVKLIGEEPEPAPPAGPNIVWVTETCDDDLDGIQDDQAWIDWLAAEGYTVDVRIDYWLEFDAGKVDELNAADLVIVSRSATSGGYIDGDEPTLWNSVTTPLITFNVHLTRSNRWLWINSTSILHLNASMMTALVLDHPVFDGVTLDPNNQVQALDVAVGSGQTTFVNTLDVGNGILIAQSADGLPWIAEWEAGVEFYNGAGQIPAGKRMMFVGGTQEDTTAGAEKPQGAMNLTAEGQQIFLNAIAYLLPEAPPINLVQNGTFDDDSAWTVIEHTVPAVTNIDLAYSDDAPANGEAPCLRVSADGVAVSRPLIYQKLTLTAGATYQVTAAIKIVNFYGPASYPPGPWFQIYMNDAEPDPPADATFDWNPSTKLLNIAPWSNCFIGNSFEEMIGADGLMEELSGCSDIGDNTGLYIPPGDPGTDVDIWLVIKPGMWAPSDVVGGYDVLFDDVGVYPVE